MRIEGVDFYYLSMPEVLDIGDGSFEPGLVSQVIDLPRGKARASFKRIDRRDGSHNGQRSRRHQQG